MTKEQFKNKYLGKAVHCDTKEKAKEFLKLAHDFGCKWLGGEELLDLDKWENHKDETCYRVRTSDEITYCPKGFYESVKIEVIEFESEEKNMKETKKVFDLGLYMDWAIENRRGRKASTTDILSWAFKSHGKTEEEMRKNGNTTIDEWMKEVEVKNKPELSEKEIEVLKALKVLDFGWIARDWDNELYAYVSKPFKKGAYFEGNGGNNTGLEKDLFDFISWEDEKPTSIEELLKNE